MNTSELEAALVDALHDLAAQAERSVRPVLTSAREDLAHATPKQRPRRRQIALIGGICVGAALTATVIAIVVTAKHRDRTIVSAPPETTTSPSTSSAASTTAATTSATSPPRSIPSPPAPWDPNTTPTTTVAGDKLVVLGQTSDGATVVQVFDLTKNAWTGPQTVPILPAGVLTDNGPGAWTGTEVVYAGASFDPGLLQWKVQSGFDPDPNFQLWWATWTGREVVFLPGGKAYDPATDTWRVIAGTPLDLRGSNPAWTGAHIDIRDGSGTWWAYSPADDSWVALPVGGPTDGAQSAAAWDGTSLVVVAPTLSTYVYVSSTKQWGRVEGSPMPSCDSALHASVSGELVVVAGTGCGASSWVGGIWTHFEIGEARAECLTQIDTTRLFDACASRVLPIETIEPLSAPTDSTSKTNASGTTVPVPRVVPVEPSIVATIPVTDGRSAIASAGGRIWVGSQTGAEIVGIDPASNTVVAHIARANTVAMAIDGNSVLDACSNTDIAVIDPHTGTVTKTLPYGCFSGLTFDDHGDLWIESGIRLTELDASGTVLGTVPISRGGWGVAFKRMRSRVASASTCPVRSSGSSAVRNSFPPEPRWVATAWSPPTPAFGSPPNNPAR